MQLYSMGIVKEKAREKHREELKLRLKMAWTAKSWYLEMKKNKRYILGDNSLSIKISRLILCDNFDLPFWALSIISVALAFRACCNGRSLNLKKEMKKLMKEKAVIERILHLSSPSIKNSILFIVSISNIIPPTCCKPPKNNVTLSNYIDLGFLTNIQKDEIINQYLNISCRVLCFPHFQC